MIKSCLTRRPTSRVEGSEINYAQITGCGGTYQSLRWNQSGLIRCLARASRPLRLTYRGSVGALSVSAFVNMRACARGCAGVEIAF